MNGKHYSIGVLIAILLALISVPLFESMVVTTGIFLFGMGLLSALLYFSKYSK
jgi:hypothetical protein